MCCYNKIRNYCGKYAVPNLKTDFPFKVSSDNNFRLLPWTVCAMCFEVIFFFLFQFILFIFALLCCHYVLNFRFAREESSFWIRTRLLQNGKVTHFNYTSLNQFGFIFVFVKRAYFHSQTFRMLCQQEIPAKTMTLLFAVLKRAFIVDGMDSVVRGVIVWTK